MISDAIDAITEAREALERLDKLSECEVRFALVHCVRALRKVQGAQMSPNARIAVTTSIRIGSAALGIDHE